MEATWNNYCVEGKVLNNYSTKMAEKEKTTTKKSIVYKLYSFEEELIRGPLPVQPSDL